MTNSDAMSQDTSSQSQGDFATQPLNDIAHNGAAEAESTTWGCVIGANLNLPTGKLVYLFNLNHQIKIGIGNAFYNFPLDSNCFSFF